MTFPTVTSPGAAPPGARTIATAGTLTVYVPHSTWSYLTDGRPAWRPRPGRPDPADRADPAALADRVDPTALAARVRDYIGATLIPTANQILNDVCPDAGTEFTPDPFLPMHDADRHGFAVRGRLTIYAPRSWGEMFIDADHPQPPSDAEIATDLDGFAKEILNEKFSDHLAVLCPGAGVWYASLEDDSRGAR